MIYLLLEILGGACDTALVNIDESSVYPSKCWTSKSVAAAAGAGRLIYIFIHTYIYIYLFFYLPLDGKLRFQCALQMDG